MQIEGLVIERRRIDLEIARVNHHPERRRDRQCDAVDCRVRHMNELDPEGAGLDDLLGLDRFQPRLLRKLMFLETALDQSQGEGGAVDRDIEFRQKVGDGADVILMAMRQEQRPHMLLVLDQVSEVRSDDIDSEQFRLGEHHAAIDDDDVIAIAEGHDVHSKLAESA
jgi:hypothetical protein